MEDLLFLEPETVCVDTNLTLDLTMTSGLESTNLAMDSYVLTDCGGFSNLVQSYPEVDLTDAQANNPDLYGRAYKSARLNNDYTAAYLNVTSINGNSSDVSTKAFSHLDSYLGKSFLMALPETLSFGEIPAPGTRVGYGARRRCGCEHLIATELRTVTEPVQNQFNFLREYL